MKLHHSLIAGACLAACSASSFAATAACPATIVSPTTGAEAETIINNCIPAATIFIGGASTQSGNLLPIAQAQLFDPTFTPIEVKDNITTSKVNVKGYVGKAKTGLGGLTGKLIYVVYNWNNGSSGGVSQLLGKTPKLADQSNPLKAIPEADVPFVGPAKDQFTPDKKTANAFCGTAATGVASTATLVACNSHTTQTADLALSDTRAQELYAVYPAAAKGKPASLTQVPLALQSFGVAVSPALYTALQTAQGLGSTATAVDQPSIKSSVYASLVSKGGTVDTLTELVGGASPPSGELVLARRDDLSGTQAVSNIFFVNGQCGGNGNEAVAKSVDEKVKKAGGLLGGLAIRSTTDSVPGVLTVQSNVTSTDVKNALNVAGVYAIGVLGTGGGGAQGAAGHFVKIDGISPNYDGIPLNFRTATATRAQIVDGTYPFAYTLYGMYVTKTVDAAKYADKKLAVTALINGFKDSNLSNLAGFGYLDGAVPAKQTAFTRKDGNNCSPIVKL